MALSEAGKPDFREGKVQGPGSTLRAAQPSTEDGQLSTQSRPPPALGPSVCFLTSLVLGFQHPMG